MNTKVKKISNNKIHKKIRINKAIIERFTK